MAIKYKVNHTNVCRRDVLVGDLEVGTAHQLPVSRRRTRMKVSYLSLNLYCS